MNTRDSESPAIPPAATHAEVDALLRQIAILEARLAAKESGEGKQNENSGVAEEKDIASASELADLGRIATSSGKAPAESYASLTEVATRLCRAARAGIWLFDADHSAITCEDLFEAGPARHSGGAVIRAQALPNYFAALGTGEIIDAGDVNSDPRTAEFPGAFLAPMEIGALLDVPVVDGANLAGVLHIEHLGGPRTWTAQERLCAITIATRISLAIRNQTRSKSEEAEQRNVELLRMAAETAHIIAWEWNPDDDTIFWGSNPEWLLGPLPATGSYPGFEALVLEDDQASLLANARTCIASGTGFVDSFRLRRTDGGIRWILVRGEIAQHGDEMRLIGIAVDNHDQRQAEIQSEQLSRQHRALLDNLPDLAWTKDLDGRYTAVNRAFAASLGRQPGEIIGKISGELLPPQVRGKPQAQDEEVIRSKKTLRDEGIYMIAGKKGWAEVVKAPIFDRGGKVIGVVGVAHDLTDRKRAEQQLEDSEKRFRSFAELGADWYWKQDVEFRMVELTASGNAPIPLSDSFGLRRWEMPGVDPSASDWEAHKADLENHRPFRDFLFAVINTDRRRVWARVSGEPLFDRDGKFAGYHGVGRDITAQMRATEELRITQERLQLALNGSQLCLWDLDIQTGAVYLSEGWTKFVGEREGPTQTTFDLLNATVHPDDRQAVRAAYIAAVRGDKDQYEVEHRSRICTGEYRWLYSRGKVTARGTDGRATRMSGTNLDIHDRKTMQDAIRSALREQETLMDTCPTGLAILRNRVFVRCNAATCKILGYQPEDLIGKSTRLMFPDEANWAAMGKLLYSPDGMSGPFAREIELRQKDGTRVWVLLSGHIIDAVSNYGIFSIVDITAQRHLADALAQAKESADSANRAKSGFLATMSHEIRTPMNGVLGMLELLELGGLEPAQRETVHTIRGQAHALLGLIDEILDFSKIEAGQLLIRPEPVSIANLIEQLNLVYQELASRKNLAFTVKIDPDLAPVHIGDGVRIRQVIGNFLSNAVKFTDKGRIGVTIDARNRDGNKESLSICVEDTGIGISPDDQTRLFQPFVQVDSRTTRRYGGTGLGLSICKRLAEAMGGEVRMESVLGRGTSMTLCLTLPVASETELPEQASLQSELGWRPADLNLTKQTTVIRDPILIAEDHVINLRLIQRQLEILGYQTDPATNGIEALEKWRRNRYSLLITDCHMPGMDGFELTRTIRQAEKEKGVSVPLPIIACTADALAEDAELCLSTGMSDYVAKPVSIATLQNKLARWLPAEATQQTARESTLTVLAQTNVENASPKVAVANPAPLDPRALLEFSGGDLEAEREILQQFCKANESDSEKLLRAIDGRDETTVLHTSHRIKGACRAIGALPLADLGEQIEKSARAHDWINVIAARKMLLFERDRLIEHINLRMGDGGAMRTNPQQQLPLGISTPSGD